MGLKARREREREALRQVIMDAARELFVEAKALGGNLNDRRWANQIMGYAAVAGVEWVVLTNGDEYRIYNSHATVPVEQKVFRTTDVDAVSQMLWAAGHGVTSLLITHKHFPFVAKNQLIDLTLDTLVEGLKR